MQGVIDLVQDRRRKDPDGLVALDLLQAHAKGVGPSGRFLRGRELGAKAQVVGAHAEERPDQDRRHMVDDVVRMGQGAREGAQPELGLGKHVEEDVRHAGDDPERHIRDETKLAPAR